MSNSKKTINKKTTQVEGDNYGFIVLSIVVLLSVLTQSISASFGGLGGGIMQLFSFFLFSLPLIVLSLIGLAIKKQKGRNNMKTAIIIIAILEFILFLIMIFNFQGELYSILLLEN